MDGVLEANRTNLIRDEREMITRKSFLVTIGCGLAGIAKAFTGEPPKPTAPKQETGSQLMGLFSRLKNDGGDDFNWFELQKQSQRHIQNGIQMQGFSLPDDARDRESLKRQSAFIGKLLFGKD